MKKFEQFINELKWQTYDKAANKLRKHGQGQRAGELSNHARLHPHTLRAFDKYKEFNKTPLHIWDGLGKKLPVYFTGFELMELVDDMAGGHAGFILEFIYKDISGEWKPFHDVSGTFNIMFSMNKSERNWKGDLVSTGNPGVSIVSWGEPIGDEENAYPRFTNRRDAMRLKQLIINDEWLLDKIERAIEDTDDGNHWDDEDNRFTARDMYKYLKNMSLHPMWSPNPPKESMFDGDWLKEEDGGQTYKPDYGSGNTTTPNYKYDYVPTPKPLDSDQKSTE